MTLKLTWVAPDGTETVFSRDATDYRLLKKYDGFSFTPATHQFVTFPYQHGATLTNTVADPREVSFEVMILAANLAALEVLIENLSDQFNPLGETGFLIYENESGVERRIYAKSNRSSLDMGTRTATSQKVMINLIAHDPFWYSGESHIAYVSPPGTPMFPFSFPWTIGAIPPSPSVVNAGTMDASIKVVITGPIENPVLTNTTTGKVLTVVKNLAAGDVLNIDTEIGHQTATYTASGGTAVNAIPDCSITADFWQLVPGSNVITLTCDSSSSPAQASIEWSDKYAGI